MANTFIGKHRRKSVLAALLFIFQGRIKYVTIALLLLVFSIPFVISGETLGRIIELRPVAAFLRTVGLGSRSSVINPRYSRDILRAALDKAADESVQSSFWAKFFKSINAALPAGGGPSSLAMVRPGGDNSGPPKIKEGKAVGPDQVKGVVNDEERQRGETGDEVNLENPPVGGLYGNSMGRNLADNFGGAGSGGHSAGMYDKVMDQSAGEVPVPGPPGKINIKKMGRISGFSWRNVRYKTSNTKMNLKLNTKKPLFQLAETFAMTGAAFNSRNSEYEYQAAYVGSTYDGNDSDLDVIQSGLAVEVPDTAFTGDTLTDAKGLQSIAKECSNSQGTHGAKMSKIGKMMKDIGEGMGSPPQCCSSRVSGWNSDIDSVIALCLDWNANSKKLSAACQNEYKPMHCNYGKYKVTPCSKLRCFLAMLLFLLFAPILLAIGLISVIFGGQFLGPATFFFNLVSGGKPFPGIDDEDREDLENLGGNI